MSKSKVEAGVPVDRDEFMRDLQSKVLGLAEVMTKEIVGKRTGRLTFLCLASCLLHVSANEILCVSTMSEDMFVKVAGHEWDEAEEKDVKIDVLDIPVTDEEFATESKRIEAILWAQVVKLPRKGIGRMTMATAMLRAAAFNFCALKRDGREGFLSLSREAYRDAATDYEKRRLSQN